MVRSRLFWKLFLGFTLVNALAAGALVWLTWRWQSEQAASLIERQLTTAAELLEPLAVDWAGKPSETNAESLRRSAEKVGVRFRVRTTDGDTVESASPEGDSSAPASLPYVRRELVSDKNPLGDLRVWRPHEEDVAVFEGLGTQYLRYMLLAGLAMIAAGYGVVTHLVGPVRSLSQAAQAMSRGDYDHRAYVANRDELGALARSFNEMSEELGKQLNELRESDHRQATVLGGMIEGVVAIDEEQRVLFANAAAGKLFGFLPSQAQGRPLLEAVRNHHLHKATRSAIASGAPQRLEVDWEERVLSVQVTPLSGEPSTGAIVVLHDTTELRRLESLRRDFVANVSHELKTPLSSIKANAETLLRGAIDDQDNRVRFLEGISTQSDRLESLIQDMLNLARIESAQQPFEIQPVAVETAVNECLGAYEQRAEAKGIALASGNEDRPTDAKVRVDPEGLRVILSNLVDNALKYTPAGGEVGVTWSAIDSRAPMIRIEVADNGVGIPEEKIDRVFERFFRVDEARTSHEGGTGLGLSIVKHLAKSFGGDVDVASQPNRGATFSVTLPAA